MASVAVPMITSKAIGMVGEKMGVDPRITAVASAMGGFGAGTAYSSFSGAKAVNAANAAGNAANTFGQEAFNATGVNVTGKGPGMLNNVATPFRPQVVGNDTTFGNEWDKNIDKWKTRPTDDQGRETGLSNAENLGAEMLSTVMSPLPEEPRPQMIGGGGGGGGGSAAPYRGGSGFVERKVLSNLGGNRERRFKPQGI